MDLYNQTGLSTVVEMFAQIKMKTNTNDHDAAILTLAAVTHGHAKL